MSQEIRTVMSGDTRTLISMYLKQPNTAGVLTAVDLTGLVSGDVQFEMYNAADAVNTIAVSATGVTFSADDTGQANYQFQSTIAAGLYNGFFVLTVDGKTDHFPFKPGLLRIEISDHSQTAQEAYAAAVAGE